VVSQQEPSEENTADPKTPDSSTTPDSSSKPDFMVWPPIPDRPLDVGPGTGSIPVVTARRRRRPLLAKLLVGALVLGIVLAGAGVGAFFLYQRDLNNNIGRIGNPFTSLPPAGRPKAAPPGAMNILLLGSDNRISSAPGDWAHGAQSTDAIMIAHVPANRAQVTVTSIPRDSLVTVPNHGKNKLNASFALGGPSLMVQTVENLTGIRIDHVVILDFAGFKDITDELGGVQVVVPRTTGSGASSVTSGSQLMDGATALNYVRQRQDLPGGDLARVRRQQNWIRAVTLKTLDKGTLTSPHKLTSVLGSLTSSVAADDDFTISRMRSLAISLRGVRSNNLTFLTAPVARVDKAPAGKLPVVHLDVVANRTLWAAVADDDVNAWLAAHPQTALGGTVR